VKPRSGDNSLREQLLQDSTLISFGLNEEAIKSSPSLETVLEEFTLFCREKLHSDSGRSFQVITDGQLHLRQVLHPESCRKSISLPPFFSSFYDLRKEFTKMYMSSPVAQVPPCIPTTNPTNSTLLIPSSASFTPSSTPNSSSSPSPTNTQQQFHHHHRSIQSMINFLSLEADASADPAIQAVQNMANIIIRLMNDGMVSFLTKCLFLFEFDPLHA